jgi:protein O-mannosyl-transferase
MEVSSMHRGDPGSKTWRTPALAVVALVAMTLVAYVPVMRGGFIFDGGQYVAENSTLHDLQGLRHIWFNLDATPQYYPLTFTSFWIEYHLWGVDTRGYHAVNVLLHGAGAVLLWRVLRRLSVPGAWLAAAVFAVHPVNVESVAWITERKNVLSGFFSLAAILAHLRFCPLEPQADSRPRAWRFYALLLVFYACALFSKTVTCALPAVLVVLLWWKRDRLRVGDVVPLVPMFAMGAVMAFITAWVEKHRATAQGGELAITFVERCLIAGRALWFYAAKVIWPARLTFIYPRWHVDATVWWQYLYPLAAAGVIISLWLLRRRIGKGPVAAVAIFAGLLVPALGFFNVCFMRFSFVADHFQYLAGVAAISAGVALAARFLGAQVGNAQEAMPRRPGLFDGRAPSIVLSVIVLGILAASTSRQGRIYKDREALWLDTITKNPDAWVAHANLGVVRAGQGRDEEALACYDEALRLNPNEANYQFNAGEALRRLHRNREAIERYRAALKLAPGFARAHLSLALTFADEGTISDAIVHYRAFLEIQPDHFGAHNNVGLLYDRERRFDDAVAEFSKAIQLKPDDAGVRNNLGITLARMGRFPEAADCFRKALAIHPNQAGTHNNLGQVLAAQGRPDEAIRHFAEALQLRPDFPDAQQNLRKAALQARSLGAQPQSRGE